MTISEEFRSAGRLLASLGITANYMGFYYASYAVSLAAHDHERLLFVTKSLYPDVAKHYRTSWKCVERNIRTITRISWEKNPALLAKLAGHPLDTRPGAAMFLAILTAGISRRLPDDEQVSSF